MTLSRNFQKLCSLILLLYVYMVNNRNFAPLNVLTSVYSIASMQNLHVLRYIEVGRRSKHTQV